ncbi:two component sigma-54-specific transcriptional regulator [Formosa agariphila KMM 3901]|uniref:Two component sigma-54-specific transcriptional regulator n=1 Tax=Formosa agariphila (strain DSM 15362 / KCTC 12365 / LMG 23005 / KMM 3901 / M-2Alg 35-1) TaxID=1347342 RepID=T2KLB8_FORAG|nr:sigma-54 dependent transcriptional regulator [Formosa agariphila]CDF79233.1 two component sigma-54-specific transcriptional regulator [Formosa agariphila KMM 3901]
MSLLKENILIVDDDVHILELLQRHLQSLNYHTFKAISVREAVTILKDTKIDVLITDLKMPEIDGFELLKFASEHYPNMSKLVITGFPSIQDSLAVIKSGVVEYLRKPFTRNELIEALNKTLAQNTKPSKSENSSDLNREKYGEIIGKSKGIKHVIQLIERVKNNKATVFISGESGTGKELVARSIHYQGQFSKQPFIAVNCGGIPENLLEAELFGYVKGAFTGADTNRNGFFQAANGGTIFLDEIGNASLAVQSRLLRVLQEKEVVKVGAQKSEKMDLRIITATNSNLKEMIKNKTFREDLYYRLTVVEINVPPLRERSEDIPLLVDKFLFKYGLEYKDKFIKIDPAALKILERYTWPGNIRELENILQRAIILSDNTVTVESLPESLKYDINFSDDNFISLKAMEKQYILKVLHACDNNKTKASEILQINRKTLREKLKD